MPFMPFVWSHADVSSRRRNSLLLIINVNISSWRLITLITPRYSVIFGLFVILSAIYRPNMYSRTSYLPSAQNCRQSCNAR